MAFYLLTIGSISPVADSEGERSGRPPPPFRAIVSIVLGCMILYPSKIWQKIHYFFIKFIFKNRGKGTALFSDSFVPSPYSNILDSPLYGL